MKRRFPIDNAVLIAAAKGSVKRRLRINRLPIRSAMLIIAPKDLTKRLLPLFLAILIALTGCGYHVAGKAMRLPPNVSTIAVPMFVNQTQTYRIEQVLTREVVRELVARTHYHVMNNAGQDADLVLKGTVVSAQAAPLTYDAQSGRISSAVVTVSMKVSLTDHRGRVFFENQNYTFRQEYQVSREVKSFFEEETPALQRMSQDFARTLVSDVLEAY